MNVRDIYHSRRQPEHRFVVVSQDSSGRWLLVALSEGRHPGQMRMSEEEIERWGINPVTPELEEI